VFFRADSILAKRSSLRTGCLFGTTTAFALDIKVRAAGWHFFWLQDVLNSSAAGRSEASARSHAIARSLKKIREPFNVAELQLITVKRYLGFWVANVMLITRHIQIGATI
jgi:hypothetical protein